MVEHFFKTFFVNLRDLDNFAKTSSFLGMFRWVLFKWVKNKNYIEILRYVVALDIKFKLNFDESGRRNMMKS